MINSILKVQGMSCQHCVKAIENRVGGLNGVSSVAVNLANSQVDVAYNESHIGLDDIKAAIEDAGYDVL